VPANCGTPGDVAEAPAEADAPAPEPDGSDGGASTLPPEARPVARSAEHLVKEGVVRVEVEEGAFFQAYERVIDIARRLGGSVTASTSRTAGDGATTGAITVRVPVDTYEDLLVRVARIGRVVAQDVATEDVTSQVVDLEARLRHLRAQESFYLGLLDEARSVQDAIAVQHQVDEIQQRVEQLQARRDNLTDRAAFSTLTVELVEAGADPTVAAAPNDEPDLAIYWHHARRGFVTIVGWVLVSVVTFAPIIVALLAGYATWRIARRRQAAPATLGPEA
jgi:hypothetical protein